MGELAFAKAFIDCRDTDTAAPGRFVKEDWRLLDFAGTFNYTIRVEPIEKAAVELTACLCKSEAAKVFQLQSD